MTTSSDKTAKLWDREGKLVVTMDHLDNVNSAVFSPDGSQLLTASSDRTAKLWDIAGKLMATMQHQWFVNYAVFFSDGSQLLTASQDDTIKIWDTPISGLRWLRINNNWRPRYLKNKRIGYELN